MSLRVISLGERDRALIDTRTPIWRCEWLGMEDVIANEARTARCDDWIERTNEFARHEPAKAVASAFTAGLLLNVLPIGAIAGSLTTLALRLARPALFLLGVIKVCELSRKQNH